VRYGDYLSFVMADIPGLIQGASEGHGLGLRFLRHIERTRVLVHVVDVGNALLLGEDPIAAYEAIRKELGAYATALTERIEIVALNKIDLLPDRDVLLPIEAALRERCRGLHRISSATGEGLPELLVDVARSIEATEAAA
jgi:GTP-binding protein